MNPFRSAPALGLVTALLLAQPAAFALQRGTTPAGGAYVSGGISESEQAMLRAERSTHTFWLITAAKGSGAYLADVLVRITDARNGQPVLEHRLDGPFLMVDLPPGRYRVEATVPKNRRGVPETQRTTIAVSKGGLQQSVLYFDTGDLTEADLAASEAARKP